MIFGETNQKKSFRLAEFNYVITNLSNFLIKELIWTIMNYGSRRQCERSESFIGKAKPMIMKMTCRII